MAPTPPRRNAHIVTVAIEDYFQVGTFNKLIQHGQWSRFEARIEANTRKALGLLDEYGVRATFFVLGWIAERMPEVVREVARRGHEVANRGYYHRSVRRMTPGEFRDDLQRAQEAIERAAGVRVRGYRVADGWFGPDDLWALDVLAEAGYAYDSSLGVVLRAFSDEPWRRFAHVHRRGEREIWEFPPSSLSFAGWALPIAGGNYFRQFPHRLLRAGVAHWDRAYDAPFVMYFHVWELDPNQPVINASWLSRLRHYRNLDKLDWVLPDYFERYPFTSIAEWLDLPREPVSALPPPETPVREALSVERPGSGADVLPVTIVVPCFNEELVLPYLANTLEGVTRKLADRYDLRFVFVDDCSHDGTARSLERLFGGRPDCAIVRHDRNRGVAAAILTGIRAADTEVVCSIDCDCTYDPHQLEALIPLLVDGVDLVTASPYHRLGRVENVPPWRLFLSRNLSRLYRTILRNKLATYTSCFRVYRRSAMEPLALSEGGFLGMAEMIALLDRQGRRVVETPAVLEARVLGLSKMKTLATIRGHLRLLSRLAWRRVREGPGRISPEAS